MAGPHAGQPVAAAGARLAAAVGAVVLVHGRGASAESILGLGAEVAPDGVALLAPQAAGGAWYPNSFLAPLAANEPWLSSGIDAVLGAVALAEAAGIDRRRVALGGFSQGACLALEVAARAGGRWAAVFALSGGLIGTGDAPAAPRLRGMGGSYADKTFDYSGSLDGTPVFLGCSDTDLHIPLARVERSAEVLRQSGAAVDARVYPGMGHTVNRDELDAVGALLAGLAGGPSS